MTLIQRTKIEPTLEQTDTTTERIDPMSPKGNGARTIDNTASDQVDAIIARSPDWRGETLSLLRGWVANAAPGIVEEVKWKKPSRPEGVPVWSRDGIICTGEMLKDAVRLTFPRGADVKDPSKLFNARLDSATVRAIDVHHGEKVRKAALKAIVCELVALNIDDAEAKRASNGKERNAVKTRSSPAAPPRRTGRSALSPDDRHGRPGNRALPGGVVHRLPPDLRTALIASPAATAAWVDITPLARNEFICWVEDAKQEVTRERRIRRTREELEEGQRRPCCWPGCKHRERNGRDRS